ncbi:hypothetical protein C9374_005380 [Naegleria lovaniensis]|uniref:Uncharacterized protein n=1 Tax=Naegleria lovaniensis TaxID=51637 RepID=A0AA88GPH0_NAELO|nr:uncharacterized protein C9374_005380 [Naegleria lovaniensis]KAG2382178.1 hypothetical protein C9374_005380 [Naegleria lovaniensis]
MHSTVPPSPSSSLYPTMTMLNTSSFYSQTTTTTLSTATINMTTQFSISTKLKRIEPTLSELSQHHTNHSLSAMTCVDPLETNSAQNQFFHDSLQQQQQQPLNSPWSSSRTSLLFTNASLNSRFQHAAAALLTSNVNHHPSRESLPSSTSWDVFESIRMDDHCVHMLERLAAMTEEEFENEMNMCTSSP